MALALLLSVSACGTEAEPGPVAATPTLYAVGGTVEGLQGSGLVLQENAGSHLAISSDGTFTFGKSLESGAAYTVTVLGQPRDPNQVCTVSQGSGTVGGADVNDILVACITNPFTVGGTVTGLVGGELVLANNEGDELTISTDGAFVFELPLEDGSAYAVSIHTQPAGQVCTVLNATGALSGSDVTTVAVTCTGGTTDTYTIGGLVTGLDSGHLVLGINGTFDTVHMAVDGAFDFYRTLADNDAYEVTVLAHPVSPNRICTVENGVGTVSGENVDNIIVECTLETYTLSGYVTDLNGEGLVLRELVSGEILDLASNNWFTLDTPLPDGSYYEIGVQTNPSGPSQTCYAGENFRGTISGSDVVAEMYCISNEYYIGASIAGHEGSGLLLTVHSTTNYPILIGSGINGTRFFVKAPSGSPYSISITTQPTRPNQICSISNANGTVPDGGTSAAEVTCVTSQYTVGGEVSGLAEGVELILGKDGEELTVTANGAFAFDPQNDYTTYDVIVVAQPSSPNQSCTVLKPTGRLDGGNQTDIQVVCETRSYALIGSVIGLSGAGLVLQNEGIDLPIAADGAFEFPALADGTEYDVTVSAQPGAPSQTCSVTNGSGVVSGTTASGVKVDCSTNMFTVGGSVTGLTGEGLTLQINGGEQLAVNGNGAFAFTAQADQSSYNVTILHQPTNPAQECSLSNPSGTLSGADITSIAVDCTGIHTVSVAVFGLEGPDLVLRNNGGDDLEPDGEGRFVFATALEDGSAYDVEIVSTPTEPRQKCSLTGETSGIVTGASVTDIRVTCVREQSLVQVSTGTLHACGIYHDGRLRCWGDNTHGQLGLGDTLNRGGSPGDMGNELDFVDLGTGRTAVHVSAGYEHTCAILDNGDLKCWGRNNAGQLGQEDIDTRGIGPDQMGDNLDPINLGTGRTALQVSASHFWHTCAVLDNGDTKCWGNNLEGQLGLGDTTSRGGSVDTMGDNLDPINLGAGRTALQVAAGDSHSCALLDDGSVKCWGWNNTGQLGLGIFGNQHEPTDPVLLGTGRTATAISTGSHFACAILDGNEAKCWGSNGGGQLGQGDTTSRGNTADLMGDNLNAINLGTGRTIASISTGGAHSCAHLDNGDVKCWGFNGGGRLGTGDTANRGTNSAQMGDALATVDMGTNLTIDHVAAGGVLSCAVLNTSELKCWGANGSGQLGLEDTENRGDEPGEMGDDLPTVNLGTYQSVMQVAAGLGHTCARRSDGSVKCWGNNTSGQLGVEDYDSRGTLSGDMGDALDTVDLGTGRAAMHLSAGGDHTCALLDDATLKCWGNNIYGQLGLGDGDSRGGEPGSMGDLLAPVDLGADRYAVDLATGWRHTCAVLDDGSVKCWGYNASGQLGLGDTETRGTDPSEMGDGLAAVDLGTGLSATRVTATYLHTCVVLEHGGVKCWGDNEYGQLGIGDDVLRGSDPADMGDALPAVDLGTNLYAVDVATGLRHTCAVLSNNRVKCWGEGGARLGLGDTQTRGTDPSHMGDDLPLVNLGSGRIVTQLSVGAEHACALLDDDSLKCWGSNGSGQLGQGDTTARGSTWGSMGDSLNSVDVGAEHTAREVSSGFDYTCAVLDGGELKCWGYNAEGQLGLGDTDNRGDAAGEMGDDLPAVNVGG